MTTLLRLTCDTAGECETIWEMMVGVMEWAAFFILMALVATTLCSLAFNIYYGGWPQEDANG